MMRDDLKNLAFINYAIDGRYDLISLYNGDVIDVLNDVSHLKFTNNVINLKENGY